MQNYPKTETGDVLQIVIIQFSWYAKGTKGRFFFRKYDAFFSLPKKCAENYPVRDILKLLSVFCLESADFNLSLGQNPELFLGNGNIINTFLRISDL